MSLYQTVIIETDLGNFEFSVTDNKHVAIFSVNPIELGKSKYTVRFHLYLNDKGLWLPQTESDISIKRNMNELPPRTHKEKIMGVVIEAWENYYKKDPDITKRAHIKSLESSLNFKEKEYSELYNKMGTLNEEIAIIKKELGELTNA